MIAELATPPPATTVAERRALIAATVVVAITRLLAISRTLWDWDEALFILGLRHYDVALHHPHPPGFPLFIGTASLFRLTGLSDFHSLQAVNVLAAIAIVPAMFVLGRELRLPALTALTSGVILASFPNVWIYGGTGFSDVPSMVLVIVAVALLLRGCRDTRAFLIGAVVTGLAAGYRPQNLAIVMAPALLAVLAHAKRRRFVPVVAALIIVLLILGASYGAAAMLTGGWARYREAIRIHQEYITTVDSFRNPGRPPLWHLIDDFFIRPYHAPVINVLVTLCAAASLVSLFRRRLPIALALAAFGPFCILAWLLLDHFSTSRFSIGYAPLIALLAAEGIAVFSRSSRGWNAAMACSLALYMLLWTWPAIREVRAHESPPVQAVKWIRTHIDPRTTPVYVHDGMIPFAEVLLPDYRIRIVREEWPPARPEGVFVKAAVTQSRDAQFFRRRRGKLFDIVRQQYFEVSVIPMRSVLEFREGWYSEETSGQQSWRWMGHRSVTLLPPAGGNARLDLTLYVPLDALPTAPNVTVRFNGVAIDRFPATSSKVQRSYAQRSKGGTPDELVIESDQVVNPKARGLQGDGRDLGLRLDTIDWTKL